MWEAFNYQMAFHHHLHHFQVHHQNIYEKKGDAGGRRCEFDLSIDEVRLK